LSIKIGLLRTGNTLFRVTKSLSFLVNVEVLYGYGEIVMRPMIKPVSEIDGKAFLSLCSGAVSAGIKKDLVISEQQRLLRSMSRPTKS
jgi:hypothetical protein